MTGWGALADRGAGGSDAATWLRRGNAGLSPSAWAACWMRMVREAELTELRSRRLCRNR